MLTRDDVWRKVNAVFILQTIGNKSSNLTPTEKKKSNKRGDVFSIITCFININKELYLYIF